ncbi:hypothetical protein AC249_AIPGENE25021 [Exaiptasia diaphana]|nr:hypothetical protein AC249_AIPGENE25021 [Exaiptasia diaphana]
MGKHKKKKKEERSHHSKHKSSHVVVKFDLNVDNANVEVLCGQLNKPGSQDGVASSASFQSPHGLATFGDSIFVCDTGNRRIRLVSSAIPLRNLSSIIYPYAELFNLDHYRGTPRKNYEQSLEIVERDFQFFLAILMKDVLLKKTTTRTDLDFADNTVDILWLDNAYSGDSLSYREAYRDDKNSPYTIVDKVTINIEEEPSRERLYTLSQEKASRIERRLQGGVDSG